jgi:hypothetical protein
MASWERSAKRAVRLRAVFTMFSSKVPGLLTDPHTLIPILTGLAAWTGAPTRNPLTALAQGPRGLARRAMGISRINWRTLRRRKRKRGRLAP